MLVPSAAKSDRGAGAQGSMDCMNASASISPTPVPAEASLPAALLQLPTLTGIPEDCPRRARQHLDLLLLALEALDLGAPEAILWVSRELGLESVLRDRVQVWRLRSTNPLRRLTQRQSLSQAETQAIAVLISNLAQRLTVPIRQILLTRSQIDQQGGDYRSDPLIAFYLDRFRSHFKARMNPKRAAVISLAEGDGFDQLALSLIEQLLFCTGVAGAKRLWASLFDGEV
ncbi:DUF3038 domain-containing protein [Synechococcus elongatus]|uniref:DUF3038 domain-containing protein n=2 Tax=Synechococcus elongatus TaxID=32046 RepID=A0AAN1QMP5_SYNEL|nr:DUF3038 domain-containing protein [Synechococcus elongatus]